MPQVRGPWMRDFTQPEIDLPELLSPIGGPPSPATAQGPSKAAYTVWGAGIRTEGGGLPDDPPPILSCCSRWKINGSVVSR
jgi:hypothetical protein